MLIVQSGHYFFIRAFIFVLYCSRNIRNVLSLPARNPLLGTFKLAAGALTSYIKGGLLEGAKKGLPRPSRSSRLRILHMPKHRWSVDIDNEMQLVTLQQECSLASICAHLLA